jgi:hypothetical protein
MSKLVRMILVLVAVGAASTLTAAGPKRCLSCPRSYCGSEGFRCVFSFCGPANCCGYSCSEDPSCTLPDPLPLNIC